MSTFNLKSSRPLIIAGPCSAETEEQTIETCKQLAETGMVNVLRAGIWKPRTHPGSFEGSGLKGLAWMAKAKEITGLPIAVEVATAKHMNAALEFGVDVVWVGARTTVNPFSVQEICDAAKGTGVSVLIKNPMSPDIELWAGAVQRFHNAGIDSIGLIHRGFSTVGSEYRNNPVWHLAIEMRRRMPHIPMICDPSHICGKRDGILQIAQKSADLNYDGLIIESHIDPDKAWSDAKQQLTPSDLADLLRSIKWRKEVSDKPEFASALEEYRSQIDQLDTQLYDILSKRMDIAEKIGKVKKENDVTILQSTRWDDIVARVLTQSKKLGLSEEFLTKMLEAIHIESINRQNQVMNK